MISVYIVSVVSLKNNKTISGSDTNLGRKILSGNCGPSLLNSICHNGGYKKEIQKHTRNETVPVYIVAKVMNILRHMYIFWFMKKIK